MWFDYLVISRGPQVTYSSSKRVLLRMQWRVLGWARGCQLKQWLGRPPLAAHSTQHWTNTAKMQNDRCSLLPWDQRLDLAKHRPVLPGGSTDPKLQRGMMWFDYLVMSHGQRGGACNN